MQCRAALLSLLQENDADWLVSRSLANATFRRYPEGHKDEKESPQFSFEGHQSITEQVRGGRRA